MTEKFKSLRDSAAARWSALLIVSLTMMMAYFFTDVMGPLEAPLTTKGQLIYFEDGTYLSIDSLSKVVVADDFNAQNIAEDQTYTINTVDAEGNPTTAPKKITSIVKGLGWTSSEYGIFSGAYGYINVFLLMLFFGGIILDKMGVRFTGLLSTILMFGGAAIKWYAVESSFSGEIFGLPTQVAIACLGFAIYGVGCEITGITVTKIIAKWFAGKEMALAMGLQVALARIGTACALFFALPIAKSSGLVSTPVFIGASALCIGFLAFMVYRVMDVKVDKCIVKEKELAKAAGEASEEQASESDDQFKLSDLKLIFSNKGFWLITLLCLMFYSGVFPFLKFATNLMIIKYGVNPDLAGIIPGLLPFGTILLTPVFGSLYDKIGKGATLMILGSILLTVVHLLFAMPLLNVWWFAVIIMIILGIAFSLVPSAMWPSVPKIIPSKLLGSAYSIIFYIQNIGLSMVPVLIGNVIGKYTQNGTTDYTVPMLIFAAFGGIAVVIALMLLAEDKRKHYGLQEANKKS